MKIKAIIALALRTERRKVIKTIIEVLTRQKKKKKATAISAIFPIIKKEAQYNSCTF